MDAKELRVMLRLQSDQDQCETVIADYVEHHPDGPEGAISYLNSMVEGLGEHIQEDENPNAEVFFMYHIMWLGRKRLFDVLLNRAKLREEGDDFETADI